MPETDPEHLSADELLNLSLFEGESREAAEWIASHMEVWCYEPGQEILREDSPAQDFIIVLNGEIHIRRAGISELIVAPAGRATGVLPFSRMKTWGARGWASGNVRVARMDASKLPELVYRAPVLAQRLVAEMTDRTREIARMEEGSNRLLALGKLAAGLAHELNNPASAAVRSAVRLREVLQQRREYALSMLGETLPPEVARVMSELGASIVECASIPRSQDVLERADRESDLADWLDDAGLPADLAADLAEAGIAQDRLKSLQGLVTTKVATLGLRILVADYQILCLTRELEDASKRVAELVQAVKTYSYMDQSPTAEVDLEKGIDVTLRMFQHQLKHGIQVEKSFAPNMPVIQGNGSALNQVWTNLIDNAIDAMENNPPERQKILTVKSCMEPENILVEIGDTGAGIPEDVRSRIFEPFFTTKAVGEGTGLGLDIVQRIIRKHKGVIRVDSRPGRTVFQVRLPRDRKE